MDRFRFSDERVRPDPFIAFGIGAAVSYGAESAGFGPVPFFGFDLLATIIISAVGGLWYHYRKIL